MILLLAALAAQAADLVTYLLMDKAREVNPIIVAGGPVTAIILKAAIAGVLIAGYASFGERWNIVLLVGIVVGVIGALSNLP